MQVYVNLYNIWKASDVKNKEDGLARMWKHTIWT